VSNEEWSEPPGPHPPPGPLPDGSIPVYGYHPPPGTPGGGPAQPRVGWGPDFGGEHEFQHGGPQSRKHISGLLLGLVVLGGVAVVVVIAALALRGGDSPTVAPQPGAGQTTSTGAPDDRPETPAATPSAQDSAKTVTTNAFYTTGVQRSVGCSEPQIALNTQATVEAYYANLVACLDKAWTRQVREAEDTFVAPRVVFWTGSVQSPCSGGSSVSFYCGATQTLYLKYQDDIKLWNRSIDAANRSFSRMWATYTAGHEFGHHLQQLTGILPAARQLEYDAPDTATRLEVSRRVELQASCLSATFMGANRRSYGITGLDLTIYRRYVEAQTGDENNRGGPRDHGARTSHQYWAARGFNTLDSASCNTFTASASKVS
jgi:predicted metalloprotease